MIKIGELMAHEYRRQDQREKGSERRGLVPGSVGLQEGIMTRERTLMLVITYPASPQDRKAAINELAESVTTVKDKDGLRYIATEADNVFHSKTAVSRLQGDVDCLKYIVRWASKPEVKNDALNELIGMLSSLIDPGALQLIIDSNCPIGSKLQAVRNLAHNRERGSLLETAEMAPDMVVRRAAAYELRRHFGIKNADELITKYPTALAA
ncbi:Uncharacterised protein [Candidatus Bilamarchaeum dharawalense]|uniref:Uncharacterized protein n=1 Tax=Candidatus Bilamarchaeum dharawalense TaxID=2885759 RepID=A0A5E4LKD1_9ARCH|nr:Uncharacterised protein [Candidatus Bilamarchaeum dharawalense]